MGKAKSEPPLRQRPAFKRLSRLLNQPTPHDIDWYYQVGEVVESLCPSENRGYRKGPIPMLAAKLPAGRKSASTEGLLRSSRRFFRVFDRNTVKRLSRLASTPGNRLNWWHARVLGSLYGPPKDLHGPLKKKFWVLAEKCTKEHWSVQRLREEVIELRGLEPTTRGAKLRKPNTLSDGLWQLNSECRRWLKHYDEVWFSDSESVFKHLPKRRKADGLAARLDEAVELLTELSRLADKARQQLKPIKAGSRKTKRRKPARAKK